MNGAEKARNVYGRNLIARESDGEKAIYRYNGHGDVIALNASNGDMIAEYAYDEFGQVIEEQAAPQVTLCHPNKNGHRKASKNGMNRILSFVFERRPHLFHGSLDNEPLPT